MKAAILQCDEVLEKLQPRFGLYREMIQHMFESIGESIHFQSFDCRKDHYPSDIDDYDFYITTGSKASVYDDDPWIKNLIGFVQELDYRQKKLIGICFGHQIIAMAFNKMVSKADKGWGVGVAVNSICAVPEWMREKKDYLNIIVSHQDQVVSLPEGALIIAKSDFCPFFVVQWNNHFLSIQGHPEWNTAYSEALIKERRSIISNDRAELGLDSLRLNPDNKLFTRWVMDFVKF